MKKTIRVMAMALALLTLVSLLSGCKVSDIKGKPESQEPVHYVLALSLGEDNNLYTLSKNVLQSKADSDPLFTYEIKVIPQEEEAKKKFYEDVKNRGIKLDLMYTEDIELTRPFLNPQAKLVYNASAFKVTSKEVLVTSKNIFECAIDTSGICWYYPVKGNFQTLFVNTDLINGDALKTGEWSAFEAAINEAKAKGVTPLAAGFNDTDNLTMDALIYSTGGKAEHYMPPKIGPIVSWTNTVNQLIQMKKDGWLNINCNDINNEAAEDLFADKKTAMIFAKSDIMDKVKDKNSVIAVPIPAVNGLKKSPLDFVMQATAGMVIFTTGINAATGTQAVTIDIINQFAIVDEMSKNLKPGEIITQDERGLTANTLEVSVNNIFAKTTGVNTPMSYNIITWDQISTDVNNLLKTNGDPKKFMDDITKREIDAVKAKREAEMLK